MALALVGLSVAVTGAAAMVLTGQAAIGRAGGPGDQPARAALGWSYPPDAAVAEAMTLVGAARHMTAGPVSTAMLARADALASAAATARPADGQAWTIAAYARSLRFGPASPATLRALSASYAATPFLRYAGPWRIEVGMMAFRRIDQATRQRLTNEAVWLMMVDPTLADPILADARASPAYQPVILRWRQLRLAGDAPGNGSTP